MRCLTFKHLKREKIMIHEYTTHTEYAMVHIENDKIHQGLDADLGI